MLTGYAQGLQKKEPQEEQQRTEKLISLASCSLRYASCLLDETGPQKHMQLAGIIISPCRINPF